METKTCKGCEESKPLSEFYKHKRAQDGRQGKCKSCFAARSSSRYESKKEEIKVQQKEYRDSNRDAVRAKNNAGYASNKESLAPKRKAWRDQNKGAMKECSRRWYIENKDRAIANAVAFREANPGYATAKARKYQASKLQRTPPWADMSAIAELYAEAKRLEELTGIQFHVDHIVPLQGELVSGLHVPANLQLLPARENLSKSNSFEVAA